MADDFTSDEDKYANESFENESDNEIPGFSTSENDSEDLDVDYKRKQEMYASHTRFTKRNSFSKQPYMKYPSSSDDDDDDDVVISETIAEINTEPMIMDEACTARSFQTGPSTNTVRQFSQQFSKNDQEAEDEEDGEEEQDEVVETDEESEEEEEVASESETEAKVSQQQEYIEHSNEPQQSESDTENDSENEREQSQNSEDDKKEEQQQQQQLESIQEEKKDEQEESMDELNLADSKDELRPPRIIRYRYVATNDETPSDYVVHENPLSETEFVNYRYANAEEVYTTTELETEAEAEGEGETNNDQEFEFRVSSQTPTSFNTNDYAFHMNFMHKTPSTEKIRRPVQRKSWSFTNDRMREIERENQILLKKILTQKPTYILNPQKSKSNIQNCSVSAPSSCTRLSSAAINRKKQQRQIDMDNQVLKRKIEAIALRRPVM